MNKMKYLKNEKNFLLIGKIASVVSVFMYISYVAQIISNLQGQKGNPVQPFVAVINSTLWVIYGLINPIKKDWAIIIANAPGIVLGLVAGITGL